MRTTILICAIFISVAACDTRNVEQLTLDDAGRQFVLLGLELGEYDPYFVDSYVGPEEWLLDAKANLRPSDELGAAIGRLLVQVEAIEPAGEEDRVRHRSLLGKVRAMDTRVRMVNGELFTFAEEARLLLGVDPVPLDTAVFDQVLAEIDALLPGDGDLNDRVAELRSGMTIPDDRLDAVFNAAIDECRRRTLEHIELPEDERFRLEYVTGASWGGYLEYLGHNESLMSINTDIPMTLDRAIDLGCHEGYPGHHVYNLLVDQRYLQQRGWTEFLLQPLFAPAMLIHEGSAEYGVRLAFSPEESEAFQRDVLAPIAGVDPERLETWQAFLELSRKLGDHAVSSTAQRYLDGELTRKQAVDERIKYGMHVPDRAEKNIRFAEEVGSYVLNYSLGEELVAKYIEERAGDDDDARWLAFQQIINELPSASDIAN